MMYPLDISLPINFSFYPKILKFQNSVSELESYFPLFGEIEIEHDT